MKIRTLGTIAVAAFAVAGCSDAEGASSKQTSEAMKAEAPPKIADRVAALRDALTSTDDRARIDAVEATIAAKAVEALPLLESRRLPEDPAAAPTIIRAVALIGREASADERRRAAETLSAWLETERQRDGVDARGNVSVLVDALGDLGGRDGASALATALDAGGLPLHVETLAAQRLAALGDADAAAALARHTARVAALPKAEGIDELLRQEALAAAALAAKP